MAYTGNGTDVDTVPTTDNGSDVDVTAHVNDGDRVTVASGRSAAQAPARPAAQPAGK